MTTHILLIGGRSGDGRWLTSLGAAGGHTFVVSEEPSGENAPPDAGPEALLIQAEASPEASREVLRVIHAEPYFRRALAILSLSSQQLARARVSQLGFDDFVLRPHYETEVPERIRLHRRRGFAAVEQTRLAFPDFVVDLAGHSVHAGGRAVPLTLREFALLAHLVTRPGRVLSREDILREVWDPAYGG
jgi:DNA-binding response OmpR family regulator